MGMSIRAARFGRPPRGVIVEIACDGRMATGAPVLTCAAPIVMRTDESRRWAPEVAKQVAREAGWRNRRDERLGNAWLCPECAR